MLVYWGMSEHLRCVCLRSCCLADTFNTHDRTAEDLVGRWVRLCFFTLHSVRTPCPFLQEGLQVPQGLLPSSGSLWCSPVMGSHSLEAVFGLRHPNCVFPTPWQGRTPLSSSLCYPGWT